MSWITKPGEREQRHREVAATATREAISDILNERLWLPIYEEGGLDALRRWWWRRSPDLASLNHATYRSRNRGAMTNLVTFKSIGRYGRFANQAYQIAGLIGIARKNGFDFALTEPWRNHDGRNFEPDLDIDCFKRFVNTLPLYDGPELPQIGIPWGYHDVKLTHSCDLLGHFQSEKYFEHSIDEVKWYMRMKDEGPLTDYCAVHWRAGDYGPQASPQHPDGNHYHPRMALNYYESAIKQFGSKQRFMVFSDDVEYAAWMFAQLDVPFSVSTGRDYMEDFKLMKRCSHFIIANSSYSAMAAILGDAPDKQIVAPYPWFGGPYDGKLDPKDIYSKGWSVIDYREESGRTDG